MQPTPRNEPAPTPHPTTRTVFTRQQQLIGWLAVFGSALFFYLATAIISWARPHVAITTPRASPRIIAVLAFLKKKPPSTAATSGAVLVMRWVNVS